MTSNDTTLAYLYEFYGDSAIWFAIYVFLATLFTIISNLFFIVLTLFTSSLRKNVVNWFLLGLSISDLLHSTAHFVGACALWSGSIENRRLCSIAGLFVICATTCGYGFPALIAAERYYKISTIWEPTGFSISNTVFGEQMTLPLIFGWSFIAILLNLPLILNNAFGEDPSGFCGAKKFTSNRLLLNYEFSTVAVFLGSMAITVIYYCRLVKWLKQHESSARNTQEAVDYTRAVMRVMKIVTLLPILSVFPSGILSAAQSILPPVPMWTNRLLVTTYFVAGAANPWVTIRLIRQYRIRFQELVSMVKNGVERCKWTNRSTPVHKI